LGWPIKQYFKSYSEITPGKDETSGEKKESQPKGKKQGTSTNLASASTTGKGGRKFVLLRGLRRKRGKFRRERTTWGGEIDR